MTPFMWGVALASIFWIISSTAFFYFVLWRIGGWIEDDVEAKVVKALKHIHAARTGFDTTALDKAEFVLKELLD